MLTSTSTFSDAARTLGVGTCDVDALLDALPVGVLVTDRDGRVAWSNAAARALALDDVPALRWGVTRALLTEEAVRCDDVPVGGAERGAERRVVCADVVPVRERGAPPHAALVTVVDTTARAELARWAPALESLARL